MMLYLNVVFVQQEKCMDSYLFSGRLCIRPIPPSTPSKQSSHPAEVPLSRTIDVFQELLVAQLLCKCLPPHETDGNFIAEPEWQNTGI